MFNFGVVCSTSIHYLSILGFAHFSCPLTPPLFLSKTSQLTAAFFANRCAPNGSCINPLLTCATQRSHTAMAHIYLYHQVLRCSSLIPNAGPLHMKSRCIGTSVLKYKKPPTIRSHAAF